MMEENRPFAKRSKEEVAALITQWKESGKNKKTFCQDQQLNYLTFIAWTNKPKKKRSKNDTTLSNRFVPVTIKKEGENIFAQITLKHGEQVLFYQAITAEYIRSLIR